MICSARSVVIALALAASSAVAAAPTSRPSLVSLGDDALLDAAFAKAARGEPITIGVLGGSITQGYAASTPDQSYAARVAQWWRGAFPQGRVTLVNAGVGGTGSAYGALRARQDLLSNSPDLVILEFSVNDANTRDDAETYEGVVRQILSAANRPALVLLFMTQQDHTSAQPFDEQVGRHYALPMVSYRDGLFAMLDAKRIEWKDVSPDDIHPNDRGMAIAAGFVTDLLDEVRRGAPSRPARASAALPAPLFGDVWAHASMARGRDLEPTSNRGWTYDEKDQSWTSSTPGSALEFATTGESIALLYERVHGDFGRASVSVDGGVPTTTLEGWFDQTWGIKRELTRVGEHLDASTAHHVRVELLEATAPESHGHTFRLLAVGAGGVPTTSPATRAARP